MKRELIYSIDFGTSNSLLGAADTETRHSPIALDPFAKVPTVMRTLVYFKNSRELSFGQKALTDFLANDMSGRMIRSMKRFLPVSGFRGTVIGSKMWTLEEIVATFLRQLRETANRHFDQDVDRVVLGRPALFSEDPAQDLLAQNRLEKAAQLAGFKTIEFLPEPVAAAYRFRLEMNQEQVVLIGDFGGGTSDFTILRLSNKPFQPTDVLAIGGVPIAGDAIDGSMMRNRIAQSFGSEVQYRTPFGKNVLTMPTVLMSHLCSTAYVNFLRSRENVEFVRNLKSWCLGENDLQKLEQLSTLVEDQLGFSVFEAIEAAKIQLSDSNEGIVKYQYPGISVHEEISREKFVDYSEAEVLRIMKALDETLQKAGLDPSQIDKVCCTGGTAQAYVIRKELEKRFSKDKLDHFNHFSSIVEGLTERSHQLLNS